MPPDSENVRQRPDPSEEPKSWPSQAIQGYFVPGLQPMRDEEEISLQDIYQGLMKYRVVIGSITVTITLAAVLVALLMTPIYRAEVLIVLTEGDENQGNFGTLAGQFSGLAALAGYRVGAEKKDKAIAWLKSRAFTEKFILDEQLLPVLFPKKWDESAKQWKVNNPKDIPTIRNAYNFFNNDVRRIDEDATTGLITVAVEWTDRELATAWANLLVERLNQHLRNRAISQSERNIAYLRKELERTSLADLQQGIYRLIESQVEAAMLANVREEYAFEVIDPAVVPDANMRVRPNRKLIVAFGFMLGLILALFSAFILSRRSVPTSSQLDDDR